LTATMVNVDKIYHTIKVLLYTAKELGIKVPMSVIQKLIFLLQKEKGYDLGLEFKPFFFHAFSEELQDYVYALVELGEVDFDEVPVRDPLSGAIVAYPKYFYLKAEFTPSDDDKEIIEFFKEWLKKGRTELMKYVYKKYPEYGKYDLIRDKVIVKV
jgi:hypothetical protein